MLVLPALASMGAVRVRTSETNAKFSLSGSIVPAKPWKYSPGDNSTKLEQVATFGKQET